MAWPQTSLADYASADQTTLVAVVGVALIAGFVPTVTITLIVVGCRSIVRLVRAIATLPALREK